MGWFQRARPSPLQQFDKAGLLHCVGGRKLRGAGQVNRVSAQLGSGWERGSEKLTLPKSLGRQTGEPGLRPKQPGYTGPRVFLLQVGLGTSNTALYLPSLSAHKASRFPGRPQHTGGGGGPAQGWQAPFGGEVQGAHVAEPGLKYGYPEANRWAWHCPRDSLMGPGTPGHSCLTVICTSHTSV